MSLARLLSQLLDSSGNVKASKLANAQAFPAGTAILFAQTAAPTGWTKSTAHDNKALRVVSGTAGSGGSVAFTSAFTSVTPSGSVAVSGSVGSTTLDTSQMPSHNHSANAYYYDSGSHGYFRASNSINLDSYPVTNSTGGSGSHNHSFGGSGSFTGNAINLAVQYVDAIIATKD